MDRVIGALVIAASSFGAGAVVVAQGVFSDTADTAERLIGGAFLVIASTFAFRWTYQLLKAVREDNAELRKQLADVTVKYEQERDLRRSLEDSELTDHRRKPDPDDINGVTF